MTSKVTWPSRIWARTKFWLVSGILDQLCWARLTLFVNRGERTVGGLDRGLGVGGLGRGRLGDVRLSVGGGVIRVLFHEKLGLSDLAPV